MCAHPLAAAGNKGNRMVVCMNKVGVLLSIPVTYAVPVPSSIVGFPQVHAACDDVLIIQRVNGQRQVVKTLAAEISTRVGPSQQIGQFRNLCERLPAVLAHIEALKSLRASPCSNGCYQ